MTDNASRVFLSYSHDQKPYVRAVAHELGLRGVGTWLDEDQMSVGEPLHARLEDALRTTRTVVVFLTSSALTSPWLNFEIGAAVGAEKRLIPVFLSAAARRGAPSILLGPDGIEAFDLKPEQVAERIAGAIDASAASA